MYNHCRQLTHTSIFCLLTLLMPALAAGAGHGRPPESNRSALLMKKVRPRLQPELAARNLRLGDPIFIRIFKMSSNLEVWIRSGVSYQLFKIYPICSYSGYPGPKLHEGDWQSPEGFYSVFARQMNPNSSYHLSFDIGYPNAFDRVWQRTGSSIMVHGECSSRGCFAMGNRGMDEIYLLAHAALAAGQPDISVHVFPFRLTDANLDKFRSSPWIDFWRSMQPGYLAFEMTHTVPAITVREGSYVVDRGATRVALLKGSDRPERQQ